jgi:hypothetical protein
MRLTSISRGREGWTAEITARTLHRVDGRLYQGDQPVKDFSIKLYADGRTFDVGIGSSRAKIKFRFPT